MAINFQPGLYTQTLTRPEGLTEITQKLIEQGYTPIDVQAEPGRFAQPQTSSLTQIFAVIDGQLLFWANRDHCSCEPGAQLTVPPLTLHWYKAGANGCRYLTGKR